MTNFGFVDLLFYSTVLVLYIYAYINDTNLFNENKYAKVGFPFDDSYGRRIKFLTFINMTMQSIYFGMGAALSFGNVVCSKLFNCCSDKTNKKGQSNSCAFKDFFSFMHASIIFPIGAVFLDLKVLTFDNNFKIHIKIIFSLYQSHFGPYILLIVN